MSRRSCSPNLPVTRLNAKDRQVLEFSRLSEAEKKQYLNLLYKNKVDVDKDPNDNLYVAHIKIVKQKNLEQSIQDSLNASNVQIDQNLSPTRSQSQPDTNLEVEGKKRKEKSLPATNRNEDKQSSSDQSLYFSVKAKDSKKTLGKSRNLQSAGQLTSKELMDQYKSVSFGSPSSSTRKRERSEGGGGCENLSPERSGAEKRSKTRSKSPISDCTKECYHYYTNFSKLANLTNYIGYLRPKKVPIESLNKIIEEIFSLQFIHGTSMVKAVNNNKSRKASPSLKTNTFANFVLNYLKERTRSRSPGALEQNALNLMYSVYWFRKKTSEAELFSKFLSGEANDDDLTFFLFLRFSTEKEMNVNLPNYPAYPGSIGMSLRSCFRVLEGIYGKHQKELLNVITQKMKDHIVDEREKRMDFALDTISIYSFLLIAFEDFLFNKMNCHDNLAFTDDVINETMEEKEESHREPLYNTTNINKLNPKQESKHINLIQVKSCSQPNDKLSTITSTISTTHTKNTCPTEEDLSKKPSLVNTPSKSILNHKRSRDNDVKLPNLSNFEKASILKILAPVPSQDNSPGRSKKFGFNSESQGKLDVLQEFCLNLMLEKINEFIDIALFERKTVKEARKKLIKKKLLEIFKRKFTNIIKALFSFDKMKWLDALLIEEPTQEQLQNIEELQKELRQVKRLSVDNLNKKDITIFTNRILRTPELSIQIGRLILEFDSDITQITKGKCDLETLSQDSCGNNLE